MIAGNELEAERWAFGQMLDDSEWFYPHDIEDLYSRENFHVVVIGTAGQNVPTSFFERFHSTAQQRGRVNRK